MVQAAFVSSDWTEDNGGDQLLISEVKDMDPISIRCGKQYREAHRESGKS